MVIFFSGAQQAAWPAKCQVIIAFENGKAVEMLQLPSIGATRGVKEVSGMPSPQHRSDRSVALTTYRAQ